jgi:hypothetical protein
VGRCCRDIRAVVWLGYARARVRVVGDWPAHFWDAWC